MQTDKTQRLLLFFDSPNDAQEIINQLRNHGCPTRAHHLQAGSDLAATLQEETWDLIICDSGDAEQKWLQLIVEANKAGVPALVLSDDCDSIRTEAFATGACDVVAKGDPVHVLHAAMREIENRRNNLDKEAILADYQELQARYELLMGGSQDAIAYLTDGMHVDANEAYASQFGYDDCDELACMPVIDLIAPEEQETFKRFLRDYGLGDQQEAELETAIQDHLGSQKRVRMHFAPANYEGESCTQVIIRAPDASVTASKHQFIAEATRHLAHAPASKVPTALCYLHLQNLTEIRESVGLIAAEAAVEQLLDFVKNTCAAQMITGQISQDGLGLLHPGTNAAASQEHVEALMNAIAQLIIDIDGRSLRCKCSATLINLDPQTPKLEADIDQAYRSTVEALQRGENQFVDIYSPPATPFTLNGDDIDLDHLLRDNQLALYFQPIVSLRGEPGEYYETTCELQHIDNQSVNVDSLAHQLQSKHSESMFDRWLLMNSITQLLEKRSQCADTRLIVNLSASCLQDQNFCTWLKSELKAAALPPSSLTVQIPEHHVSKSVKQSQRLFEELNTLGCGCSIGEFGSGNNSASILQHVPVRMLKFSHDMVEQGQANADKREQLQQLIQQATKASATTIVPNVCSAAALASLWQLGASFIQGDYLQQPSQTMTYEFAEIA